MSTPDRYWRARWVAVTSSTWSPGWRRWSSVSAGAAQVRLKPSGAATRTIPVSSAAPVTVCWARARAASMSSATASSSRPREVSSQPSGALTSTRSPTLFSSAAIRRDTVVWLIPRLCAAAVYLPRRATASRVRRSSGATGCALWPGRKCGPGRGAVPGRGPLPGRGPAPVRPRTGSPCASVWGMFGVYLHGCTLGLRNWPAAHSAAPARADVGWWHDQDSAARMHSSRPPPVCKEAPWQPSDGSAWAIWAGR